MNKQEQALNDIGVIKKMIGNTKSNIAPIRNVFLIYGLLNLTSLLSTFLIHFLTQDLEILALLSLIISISIYLITATLLLFQANKEKTHTNPFFRTFISIFIFIAVFLPFIFLLVRAFSTFVTTGDVYLYLVLIQMSELLLVFLFTISLVIVASIKNKKRFTFLGIGNLTAYLLLFVTNSSLNIEHISIDYSALYRSIVTSIGFILLSILLKSEKLKNEN